LYQLDLIILKFFNITISSNLLDVFFVTICDFSLWRWPLIPIIILLLWKGGPKGRWTVALTLIAIAIIDPTIYRVIKPLVGRLRPCQPESEIEWIRQIVGCGGRYAFPSSHAANFFGAAFVIGAFYKSSRYYLLPIAFLVSIGRIYLGVHYPSDVLGGFIYGIAVGLIVIAVSQKIFQAKISGYIAGYFPAKKN